MHVNDLCGVRLLHGNALSLQSRHTYANTQASEHYSNKDLNYKW